jgi:putative FmdB family regulatory protein
MPLYDYRCDACGREIEELQAYDDPPPEVTEICSASPPEQQAPCRMERMMGKISWRWPGDYNNDGRGGWNRQGDAMVKLTPGSEHTKYGEGA